jgi:hypothetical protein
MMDKAKVLSSHNSFPKAYNRGLLKEWYKMTDKRL